MSMSKDSLEGMASILRENGYEVALKESDKKPYINNKFNKIRDLDLESIAYDTCIFLSATVVEDFKLHDYTAGSYAVTIGYIKRVNDDDDDVEDILISTNRTNAKGCGILENLSDYDYVIKLSDVFTLMDSNEDFNA